MTSKKKFIPSKQQHNFFNWITTGSGSCVLEAVAGSGKTTTLIHGLNLMEGLIFFGAFNKKIAEEIQERAPNKKGLFISTFHSAGFKVWRNTYSNVKVDEKKCKDLFKEMNKSTPEFSKFEYSVLQLVSFAKQAAVGVNSSIHDRVIWENLIKHFGVDTNKDEEMLISMSIMLLEESNKRCTTVIDFDDMIYAPLFFKSKFYKHDWVLIDEAQDSNESRRLLSLSMLKPNGRLVAVGDRHQAIYGFTGADAKALDDIAKSVNAIRLPLNTSYRCPKKVVNKAKHYVPHIEAQETAIDGEVKHIDNLIGKVNPGDAVLCRLNAPIIKLAYDFISSGIAAKVEGRDIGKNLKTLATKWKFTSLDNLSNRLIEYSKKESTRYKLLDEETKALSIEDQVNCLLLIINRAKNKKTQNEYLALSSEIDFIFGDNIGKEMIVLSTIHKAKGREWDRVFWVETDIFRKNKQEWEIEQEKNLCYVAITRSKNQLFIYKEPKKEKK